VKYEIQKLTKTCLKQLEEKKKGLEQHLIGLKFNTEGKKLAFLEAKNIMCSIEPTHQNLLNQQEASKMQICILN
jgi:hypothetical protein